jgi:uncharacterized protein (TIGR00730 family)
MALRRICVFCGSSEGSEAVYREAATATGSALARAGIGLVYGGASVGLMGAVADAALAAGGEVTGVMPRPLVDKEIAHPSLSELHVVASMHERKALMAELSSGFVALPGGIGTLEELFEVWTWAQLGYHAKPCAILNVAGFYDHLVGFLDNVVEQRFLRVEHRRMLIEVTDPGELLARLAAFTPPTAPKWIGRGER